MQGAFVSAPDFLGACVDLWNLCTAPLPAVQLRGLVSAYVNIWTTPSAVAASSHGCCGCQQTSSTPSHDTAVPTPALLAAADGTAEAFADADADDDALAEEDEDELVEAVGSVLDFAVVAGGGGLAVRSLTGTISGLVSRSLYTVEWKT